MRLSVLFHSLRDPSRIFLYFAPACVIVALSTSGCSGKDSTDAGTGGTAGSGSGSTSTGSTSSGNGSGNGSSGSGSSGSGSGCSDVTLTLTPQTPTIMLVIDQSGSMINGYPTTTDPSRWDVVRDMLMNPTQGVVKALQDKVRFGLTLYTYAFGPTCPALTKVTPPALNAYDALNAVYGPAKPADNGPTGESIAAVTSDLVAVTEPGPKLILLATDGTPDLCADPNGSGPVPEKAATDAVTAALQKGIRTLVIDVGFEVNAAHQQNMANAGQGLAVPAPSPCAPATCAPTYTPATKQDLIGVLGAIVNGTNTCVFELSGQVDASKGCSGKVLLNGAELPCDNPDGWRLNSPTEIEFVGSACQTLLGDPKASLSATFPCSAG